MINSETKERMMGALFGALATLIIIFTVFAVIGDLPNQSCQKAGYEKALATDVGNVTCKNGSENVTIPFAVEALASIHIRKPYFNIDFSNTPIQFNTSVEIGYCLKGHGVFNVTNGYSDYYIDNISSVLIGSRTSVTSPDGLTLNCSGGDLAMMHNHPNGTCTPSLADIEAWKAYAKRGIGMFLIQCENSTVAYLINDYTTGYVYEGMNDASD